MLAETRKTAKWWGRRWLQTMQTLGCVEKITRGKGYARGGHVLRHSFACGRVVASVQGSRWPPYEVRFTAEPLDDLAWRRVLEIIAQRPLYAARLLAGEVPPDVENVFVEAGLALLPQRGVAATCTCPSAERSCKHVAAVCYVAAEALETDPFQLFVWRGRTRAQLLGALRPGEVTERGLPTDVRAFYGGGHSAGRSGAASLEEFTVDVAAPPLAQAVLLGQGPPGEWTDVEAFATVLGPAYAAVSAQAARLIGPSQ